MEKNNKRLGTTEKPACLSLGVLCEESGRAQLTINLKDILGLEKALASEKQVMYSRREALRPFCFMRNTNEEGVTDTEFGAVERK